MKFVILLGKSGSGKGTQANLLAKKIGFEHLNIGVLLRKRAGKRDFIGEKLSEIMRKGGLVPTPMVFHLWLHWLEGLRSKKGAKGAVIEGSPRKLYEAEMLDETFHFYDWKEVIAVDLHISDQEAMKRLLKRARSDDKRHAIAERLKWFASDVRHVVDFYRKKKILVEVNGEQSPEKVFQELMRKLKKFLK